MKVVSFLLALALAAVVGLAQPATASATIHEIVASFCSGNEVQDPPGQSDFSKNSALRALTATGVFQGIVFDPVLGGPKVVLNFDHPAVKFSWDGTSYVDFGGLFFPDIVPDHPSFAHCKKLQP